MSFGQKQSFFHEGTKKNHLNRSQAKLRQLLTTIQTEGSLIDEKNYLLFISIFLTNSVSIVLTHDSLVRYSKSIVKSYRDLAHDFASWITQRSKTEETLRQRVSVKTLKISSVINCFRWRRSRQFEVDGSHLLNSVFKVGTVSFQHIGW